jgi:hypothetical protein
LNAKVARLTDHSVHDDGVAWMDGGSFQVAGSQRVIEKRIQ